MNIVHVYDGHEKVYGGRGSVPGVVWNVARETAAAGHKVIIIERQWNGLDASAEHEGVRFERLNLRTGADEPWTRIPYEEVVSPLGTARLVGDRVNFAFAVLRWLRKMDFDVLHVHLPFAANVLLTIAPWLRKRTVYTAHMGELRLNALTDEQQGTATAAADGGTEHRSGGEELNAPSILQALSPDIYLARRAARTTVLNPNIRVMFERRGVSPESLAVVPNGVDLERFGEVGPTRAERGAAAYGFDDVTVLLFVGTVMPRKGVDDLVRAMERLVSDHGRDELLLVIAGEDSLDGKYTSRVHERVRAAGMEDYIAFTGFVPEEELPVLYHLADVFVMPSREEGFGMTITEAMAASTPVVATSVGGIPQQVDHGDQGLLVEPGAPDEFATAIERLLDGPDERERMSERARERAREFTWTGVGERFGSVYGEVMS